MDRALLPNLSAPLLAGALLSGCALGAIATTGRSHPEPSGEIAVAGLSAPVTIHYDGYGVPHIRAESELDLWYAVGFAHARDRLFQMDLIRRLGGGRLAAWLGEDALGVDAFMASLEFEGRVERARARTSPELWAAGEAYAAGVNAGAASLPALPVEYRVLGVDFEPWAVRDAMASSVLNSWVLSENAPVELITLLLRDRLDAETAGALWRHDPGSPAVDAYWDELRQVDIGELTTPFRGLVEFLWGVETPSASNNWAIAGERTADGAPILANDPHLLQMVPSVWYVFEGSGGDVHVAGASLAGAPFPATGHNESVAWGVTNVMADYVDLAIVERSGERGYVLAGEEKALRTVDVEIAVNGQKEPVQAQVHWTEIGPVISELTGTHLVALRWSIFEAKDETGQMFYDVLRAETVHDVIAAAQRPSMISQNLVSADADGHIAWQVFGSLPQRRGYTGRVPYPASDPAYGWDGWIRPLPGAVNPGDGFIATANAKPRGPNAANFDPYAVSTNFMGDWRHDRIEQLLSETDQHTPETSARIQQDEYDGHAAELAPALLAYTPEDRWGECGELLAGWDHQADIDSPEMAVWAHFKGELIRDALADDLGEQGLALYLAATVAGRSILEGDWTRFVDDPADAVAGALARSCETLRAELGPDPNDWRWGELHPLKIRHPFSDEASILEDWSLPGVPWGGSHHTPNQAGYSWFEEDFHSTWIASLRMITPLSDPGAGTFSYPGGQSGMPGHPHYADLYAPFVAGEQLPLWFDDEDVEREAVETLRLVPE